MASLKVFHNGAVRGRFELAKKSMVIGRDGNCDIDLTMLGDRNISREHARIEQIGDRFEIRDIGAMNQIYVNGEIVGSHSLTDGDDIRIGETRLEFTSTTEVPITGFPIDQMICPDGDSAGKASGGKTTYLPAPDIKKGLRALQISRQRLFALYDLSREFFAPTNLSDLVQTVLSAVCRLTEAERAFAATFKGGLDEATLVMGHNMIVGDDQSCWPVSRTILRKVVTDGEPVLMDNAMADAAWSQVESIRRLKLRSVICFPLIRDGKPTGLVYADNLKRSSAFQPEDLDLLRALSLHVEAAMQMAESREQALIRNTRLQVENSILRSEIASHSHIVGDSAIIKNIRRRILDIAAIRREAQLSVLITGETGTGKELVAREIHAVSGRKNGRFITVNCAAIPESLIEAELFGIEKGVATGVTARAGLFEQADGGVIFLDEIGDMNLMAQAKILRVIQNQSFVRVGASAETGVDIWIVAATNKNLEAEVAAGNFREDLYYRLRVVEIVLPPLRERGKDIEQLARVFVTKYSRNFGKDVRGIEDEALDAIKARKWPGNVRELENTIAGAIAFCHTSMLRASSFPIPAKTGAPECNSDKLPSLEEMERQHMLNVLREANWNISQVARILDIGRQAVYQKIRKHDLERFRPDV